jgi:hypothetical protein
MSLKLTLDYITNQARVELADLISETLATGEHDSEWVQEIVSIEEARIDDLLTIRRILVDNNHIEA